MYGRRNPSKATRFVAQVFWLSLILTLPFEYLSWNFEDVAKYVDSYDLTYVALPDMLRTWVPEYVAWFWINKLIWSLLMAINVFAYLSIFEVPYVAPVSPSRMPYVWAAGAFLLGYLSINYLVSGLFLLIPEDELRWAQSALNALRHSLGFSLGGLLLWCSLRQGGIAQGFGRALQEHRRRLIAVTLVMFGFDFACRQIGFLLGFLQPTYGLIHFGMMLNEAGYFGSAALGLIVLSTSTMAARLRAMRGLAKHLLWLMATVAVFDNSRFFEWESISLSGVNLTFIGFDLWFGRLFVNGIGGLIVLRYAHYRIFAKLGPPGGAG